MQPPPSSVSASPVQREQPGVPSPVVPSNRLFGSARTVCIEHAGQRYTLRITRENKLILTK